MQTFTELLRPTKTAPVQVIKWTPADPDEPVEPGRLPVAGTLHIDQKRASVSYEVTEFPTPWHGRAFRFEKVTEGTDADEPGYDVFVGANGQDRLCCCKGFDRHGHCKHCDAAAALVENQWV